MDQPIEHANPLLLSNAPSRIRASVRHRVESVSADLLLGGAPSSQLDRLESVTMQKHIDTGSMVVIVITIVCFAIALVAKGLTQALLLEVGVLLVSVKLIIMAYKSSLANTEIVAELRAIRDLLEQDRA
jgi:hypothetical protein